jgi:hypothetical protein
VEFRAEFFDILNRANFDVPLNGLPQVSAAAITDTVNTSRQIHLALKVIF